MTMLLLAFTSRCARFHNRNQTCFAWEWKAKCKFNSSSDFQLAPELNPMCHFQVLIMILIRGCFAWSPLSWNQCFSSWKEVMTVSFQSRQTAKRGQENFKDRRHRVSPTSLWPPVTPRQKENFGAFKLLFGVHKTPNTKLEWIHI